MKRLFLFGVCILPFIVAGLAVDAITGIQLGFFKLLSIELIVWFALFLSNYICIGFTRNSKELVKDGK